MLLPGVWREGPATWIAQAMSVLVTVFSSLRFSPVSLMSKKKNNVPFHMFLRRPSRSKICKLVCFSFNKISFGS
jgi:hypothetical protein